MAAARGDDEIAAEQEAKLSAVEHQGSHIDVEVNDEVAADDPHAAEVSDREGEWCVRDSLGLTAPIQPIGG
jgi:hypothetical protein